MRQFIPLAPGLAVLRIAFGLYWLVQGYDKAFKQHWLSDPQQMVRFLRLMLPRSQGFYRDFLQGTVLPHAAVFSRLVALGELTAGICLVLGVFVPVGALVAIWLNCNYMLLKGLASTGGSVDRLFIAASVIFILTAAGMVWGLDGVLWRKWAEPTAVNWWPLQRRPQPR
jgi:uncharacterized membrane protein YphA (DoxX/SURF4 family)